MKNKQVYTDYFLSFLVLLTTSTLTNASTQYVITNLGTVQGFSESVSIGLNNAGHTVASSGRSDCSIKRRASSLNSFEKVLRLVIMYS